MKTTVIGSGSIFFTRQCVKGMAQSKVLRSAELALVDIDPGKPARWEGSARRSTGITAGI